MKRQSSSPMILVVPSLMDEESAVCTCIQLAAPGNILFPALFTRVNLSKRQFIRTSTRLCSGRLVHKSSIGRWLGAKKGMRLDERRGTKGELSMATLRMLTA